MDSKPDIDDVVALAPEVHEVIFENEAIRMLKVTVKPGVKVGMHTNPENVNYILQGGKLRFTNPDGSTQNIELSAGQVIPAPVGTHAVENIGDTEMQSIGVEFKIQ